MAYIKARCNKHQISDRGFGNYFRSVIMNPLHGRKNKRQRKIVHRGSAIGHNMTKLRKLLAGDGQSKNGKS